MNYDDEILMAYADGELDEAQRAEIATAAEHDPELARRIARHRALRAEVAGALAAVLEQPVPERLVAAARAEATAPGDARAAPRGAVLPFPSRGVRGPARHWSMREWGAMAASLALGAVISWKLLAPQPALISAQADGLVARGALATALDQQLASTQRGGEPVLMGLSFRMADGKYCRSFALAQSATAGLACHVDGEWRIPVTAVAQPGSGGVRQASSPPPAILQAIEARISGEPLDADGERSALGAGWDERFERR